MGGFIPLVNGEMQFLENDLPEMLVAVMPRDQITFTDNWNVTGLKGTGSFDYNVEDTFVPASRVFPLFTREPKRGSAIFKLGALPLTFAHLAAGTTSIREGSRLERAFRDIYTGSQHAFINEKTYTDSARLLMGLIEDAPGV